MTKMKTYSKAKWKDPKSVCRLCLGAVKGGVPIFDPMFTPVYNFISCVLDVSIEKHDGLPSKICGPCYSFIREVECFKMKSKAADEKLRRDRSEDTLALDLPITDLTKSSDVENKSKVVDVCCLVEDETEPNTQKFTKSTEVYSMFNEWEENEREREIGKGDAAFRISTGDYLLEKEYAIPQSSAAECLVEKDYAILQSSAAKCHVQKEYVIPQSSSAECHVKKDSAPQSRTTECHVEKNYAIPQSSAECHVEKTCSIPQSSTTKYRMEKEDATSQSRVPQYLVEKEHTVPQTCTAEYLSINGTASSNTQYIIKENVTGDVCLVNYFNEKTLLTTQEPIQLYDDVKNSPELVEKERKNSLEKEHVKPKDCPYCKKLFSTHHSMLRHQRIHTGQKNYLCRFCTLRFNQSATLRRHELTHSNEKPFTCEFCGKGFVQKGNLKSHIMTRHIDESKKETFSCKHCQKVFKHSSGLSRHTLLHKGIYYKCNICEKIFKDYSHCQRHKKAAHGNVHAIIKPMRDVVFYQNNEHLAVLDLTKSGFGKQEISGKQSGAALSVVDLKTLGTHDQDPKFEPRYRKVFGS